MLLINFVILITPLSRLREELVSTHIIRVTISVQLCPKDFFYYYYSHFNRHLCYVNINSSKKFGNSSLIDHISLIITFSLL